MPHIAIVYHSGYGHTEVIANEVVQGVEAGGATAALIKIEAGQTDFDAALDAVGRADGVIFGSPTYMGTVSAPFKAFMDASAKPWFAQAWKDKLAAGFTVSGGPSGDKLNTLLTMVVLAGQHSMLWVSLGEMAPPANDTDALTGEVNRLSGYLGAMGQGVNDSPANTPKDGDKATGRALGQRMATIAARFARG